MDCFRHHDNERVADRLQQSRLLALRPGSGSHHGCVRRTRQSHRCRVELFGHCAEPYQYRVYATSANRHSQPTLRRFAAGRFPMKIPMRFAQADIKFIQPGTRGVHAPSPERGSVLLITLVICTILGLLLGSYLSLIKTQHFSVARARAWNSALVVAEAGVEEAMAQLNDTNLIRLGLQTYQGFNANKWQLPNASHAGYSKTNILTDGVMTNSFYDVTIFTNNPANPLII